MYSDVSPNTEVNICEAGKAGDYYAQELNNVCSSSWSMPWKRY